jgi:hypothetical protein
MLSQIVLCLDVSAEARWPLRFWLCKNAAALNAEWHLPTRQFVSVSADLRKKIRAVSRIAEF